MIKIKNIQKFNNIDVIKGKLVLIENTKNILGKSIEIKRKEYKPIIISEKEEIEVNNNVLVLNEYVAKIIDIKFENTANLYYFTHPVDSGDCSLPEQGLDKILALPENFSPEILQDIVDGKLKDGDDVFIECERKTKYRDKTIEKNAPYNSYSENFIKLTNNCITIHLPQKEQLFTNFIPSIREMIKKEEEHLEKLKESKRKSSKKTLFNFIIPVFHDDEFITESNKMLNHLKTRLNEYIEYSEKNI